MTPEEMLLRMREIYPENSRVDDPEGAHGDADDLMCEILEKLGYGEAVAVFRAAPKWYA